MSGIQGSFAAKNAYQVDETVDWGQIHLILFKPMNVPTQWVLPLKAELGAWMFVEIVYNLDGKTADSGLGFPSTSNTSPTHSIH